MRQVSIKTMGDLDGVDTVRNTEGYEPLSLQKISTFFIFLNQLFCFNIVDVMRQTVP